MRKGAGVPSEASASARKITTNIARVSMEILATCPSRTVAFKTRPITTQFSFHKRGWSSIGVFLSTTCLSPTKELVA